MDPCCLLFLCKCYLEDTVFTGQMADFSALTSFLQCSCVRVMSCPQGQALIAVKRSETKVGSPHPSREGCVWLCPVVAATETAGWAVPAGAGRRPAGFSASTVLCYRLQPRDSEEPSESPGSVRGDQYPLPSRLLSPSGGLLASG